MEIPGVCGKCGGGIDGVIAGLRDMAHTLQKQRDEQLRQEQQGPHTVMPAQSLASHSSAADAAHGGAQAQHGSPADASADSAAVMKPLFNHVYVEPLYHRSKSANWEASVGGYLGFLGDALESTSGQPIDAIVALKSLYKSAIGALKEQKLRANRTEMTFAKKKHSAGWTEDYFYLFNVEIVVEMDEKTWFGFYRSMADVTISGVVITARPENSPAWTLAKNLANGPPDAWLEEFNSRRLEPKTLFLTPDADDGPAGSHNHDGVDYEADMFHKAVKLNEDGALSLTDVEIIFELALDGGVVTEQEKRTLKFIRDGGGGLHKLKPTEAAKRCLDQKLWCLERPDRGSTDEPVSKKRKKRRHE